MGRGKRNQGRAPAASPFLFSANLKLAPEGSLNVVHAYGRHGWARYVRHREDGPALELPDGTRQWYLDGRRHRTDGPAIERADGSHEWYLEGRRHREDGPAVELPDGTREWYLDGRRHRTDGPAVERANGSREWWVNGELHRADGPAVERADGTKAWWVHDQRLTEEEWEERTRCGPVAADLLPPSVRARPSPFATDD